MAVGTKVHFHRGHYIYPGRVAGSMNDVLGTWYIVREDENEVDTSGRGYPSLKAAKQSIDEAIGETAWKYAKLGDEWVAIGHMANKDWAGSEITIVTRRGQKHVRKVTRVIQRLSTVFRGNTRPPSG